LAAASVAAAVLGPLGAGLIQWHVSANLLNQTYGADAAQLLLVTPAAIAAAWLWRRQQRLAAPLVLGVGLATLYYAVASALGPDYTRYAGNNERFFLVFLALIVLGWTTALRAWTALDAAPPRPAPWLARGFGAVLVAGGALIGAAWMAQLIGIAATGAVGPEYAESPSAFWTVRIVDLGFIVPVCLATGVGLWRGSATAIKAAYGVAAFMMLQAAAVLAMGAVMLWRQDPTASPALIYALAPLTLALAALTARLLASYAKRPDGVDQTPGVTSARAVPEPSPPSRRAATTTASRA
jgi:hypothetical protein